MSNQTIVAGGEKKPITGAFELETKIRVIIQEVLAATIRKLSLFGEKIEKFQDYFITFKERFETGERERVRLQQELAKIADIQVDIRRDMNFKEIKYTQDQQRAGLQQKQTRQQFAEMQKSVKSLLRQNENINSELSKTKSKFLEYSNTITTLKEQVSWKITKYLEETADSHTQMKVYAEQIKIENFNMNLQIQKQKEKYDHIILKYEQDVVFRQDTLRKLDDVIRQNALRTEQSSKLNEKIDNVELSILGKLKNSEAKNEEKIKQLDKNNTKLSSVFKKIDHFNDLFEGVKQQIQQNESSTATKIDNVLKKAGQLVSEQGARIAKEAAKLQKKIEKNLVGVDQKLQKLEDFLVQKIEFVKMQIESDMSSKTVKMLQQKSKHEQNMSSSSIEEFNSKITKFQLETNKNLGRIESHLKEQISSVKQEVEKVKEQVQSKIEEAVEVAKLAMPSQLSNEKKSSQVGHISNEKVSHMNAEMNFMKEISRELRGRIQALQGMRDQIKKESTDLKKGVQDKFLQSEQKLNSKVEKVMFLVTKMRGDSIIRNEFNDKEIKELKKNHIEFKQRMDTTWKLIPGMGECINLVMALIFDAEYQHSKIIQDNLPMLSKDVERFNTCCEGVIYEYKEKRKPGVICYRHTEIKKADLVRATFNGYIQLWEQIYEEEFKSKQQLLPKSFFKKLVEKFIKGTAKPTSQKEVQLPPVSTGGGLQQLNSMQQMRTSSNFGQLGRSEPVQPLNTSFQIRKKRTVPLKQREQREQSNSLSEDIFRIRQ